MGEYSIVTVLSRVQQSRAAPPKSLSNPTRMKKCNVQYEWFRAVCVKLEWKCHRRGMHPTAWTRRTEPPDRSCCSSWWTQCRQWGVPRRREHATDSAWKRPLWAHIRWSSHAAATCRHLCHIWTLDRSGEAILDIFLQYCTLYSTLTRVLQA